MTTTQDQISTKFTNLSMAVTVEERRQIENCARSVGMTKSAWTRAVVMAAVQEMKELEEAS